MIQVELIGNRFEVKFSAKDSFGNKKEFEAIQIDYTSQSRVYCTAIKNGMRYTSIAKKMKFDENGNVFLKFGKNKVIIGNYMEVVE